MASNKATNNNEYTRKINSQNSFVKKNVFKRPKDIKKRFEKFIKPNSYEKLKFNDSEDLNNCATFTPNFKSPKTYLKQKPRGFYGRWFRKRNNKSIYISLEGDKLEGLEALKKSIRDKAIKLKRLRIEAESKNALFETKKDVSLEKRKMLSFYGIPNEIIEIYKEKGINELYKWQIECLAAADLINGKNLIYSAPTSGGKTIVAEILMIRRMLLTKKKCIFVLPFVSLVQEKFKDLKKKLSSIGLIVRSLHSFSPVIYDEDVDVIICTIEKANLLLNKLIEEEKLNEIGVVVIDEMHVIGDKKRGVILELFITKLIVVGKCQQIIGMSATLPNINDLSKWLKSDLSVTDFRPVPLTEYLFVKNKLFNKKGKTIKIYKSEHNNSKQSEIFELYNEVIQKGKSVLIFCPTKDWCKRCAKKISLDLVSSNSNHKKVRERKIIIEKLRQLPGEICEVLKKTILLGIAYHHAGMTIEEREIVENGFRQKSIEILTATSTLAAGVNLPAYRVIFRYPYVGKEFLSVIKYRQMSGRAGRAGIDTKGESVLISSQLDKKNSIKLINSDFPQLKSQFKVNKSGIQRIILESISSKAAQNVSEINNFVKSTFMASQNNFELLESLEKEALIFLKENNLISQNSKPVYSSLSKKETEKLLNTPSQNLKREMRKIKTKLLKMKWKKKDLLEKDSLIFSTSFGNATFYSGLNPEEALFIKNEIQRARKGLVLKGSLHICYLVTPIHHVSIEPNWTLFYQIFDSLSPVFKHTAEKIGISEAILARFSHRPPRYQSTDINVKRHRRFFLALLLHELVNETPLPDISDKFGVDRGQLQALQNSSASFSGTVAIFCQRLNWTTIASLFSHFSERVNFGVQSELLPLMQIPHVKAFRARALFEFGLKTVQSVSESNEETIRKAISKFCSYSLGSKNNDEERNYRTQVEKRTAHLILKGASNILKQKAEQLLSTTLLEKDELKFQLEGCRERSIYKDDEIEQFNELFE